MYEGVSLEGLLREKKESLEKLKREIGLLKQINFPVEIVRSNGSFKLSCTDYSRATDFKLIEEREKRYHRLYIDDCRSGTFKERIRIYPQFYFNLRYQGLVAPVYIQRRGFDKDERTILKDRLVITGDGECRNINEIEDENIDLEKVFDFFREQGVRKSLLDKLYREINQANEL